MTRRRPLTLATLAVIAAVSSPASSSDCLDYQGGLHWVGGDPDVIQAEHLVRVGGFGLYGRYPQGLRIVDLRDVTAPVHLPDPGFPRCCGRLAHDGNRLVSAYAGHLDLLSVADPADPEILFETHPGGSPRDLLLVGDLLCLASDHATLDLLRVESDGFAALASLPLPAVAINLAWSDGHLLVACGDAGLLVVDARDPEQLAIVAALPELAGATMVAAVAERAYVACGSRLHVVDIATVGQPAVVGSYQCDDGIRAVAVRGEAAFLGATGLTVLDVSGPGAPSLLGRTDFGGWISRLVLLGDHVVTTGAGLDIFDASHPVTPDAVTDVPIGDGARTIRIQRDLAAVPLGFDGFKLLDVSVPESPLTLATVVPGDTVCDVALGGERLYVVTANYPQGYLWVYDIADPTAPQLLGSRVLALPGYRMLVDEPLAVVSGWHMGDAGITVLDVANPAYPAILDFVDLHDTHACLAKLGSIVFVAAEYEGLLALDVSVPTATEIVGALETGSAAEDLALDAGSQLAYVTWGDSLRVVDIADPTHLRFLGSHRGAEWAHAVTYHDGVVYTLGPDLSVFDVTVPQAPALLGTMFCGYSAHLTAAQDRLVIAAGTVGLQLAPLQCRLTAADPTPAMPAQGVQARPNPFNPCTDIRFTLRADGAVRLELFDLRGRNVRTLMSTSLDAGSHHARWDGRDEAGRALGSGTYLIRLTGPEVEVTGKLMLLR